MVMRTANISRGVDEMGRMHHGQAMDLVKKSLERL
jgi:hypothetical protein